MQHDDVICSCPLANSRYDATIRHHDGVFYLYMKTIERAHMPNKLWERVKLPRNYEKALEIIDKHLSIDKELLERLKKGVYGDIYNYPPVEEYPEVLDSEDEMEEEMEYVEGHEEHEEEDDIEEFGGLAIQKSHIDVDDGVDDEDEEAVAVYRKRVKIHSKHEKDESNAKLKKKKARVLVEVEHENTDERQVAVQ